MSLGSASEVKQEVKLEAEDHISTQLTTPQRHMFPQSHFPNPQLAQQNSMFFKVCFEMLFNQPPKNLPAKSEPFMPFLIPDPNTLRAFANYRKEYEQFAKDHNMNPYINPPQISPNPRTNVMPSKSADKNYATNSTLRLTTHAMETESLVKKEESEEDNRVCVCPPKPEKINEKEKVKKVPKKKAQNRIKNIPGLVVQRVRSSIKNYYSLNPKLDKHERRLGYVDKILSQLNKSDKERLLAFLDSYLKNWKTWNTIQKYLETDSKYGGVLLGVILEFFGKAGEEDFNDWLISGKMGEKSKVAVTELKERIKSKFSKILSKPEDEKAEEKAGVGEGEGEGGEEDDDEEPVEPALTKFVKKEESI